MYGEKIKQLRKQANLSQAELANLVGISRPNISFWENAEYPPLDAIDRICKVFDIDIWRFFIDNGDIENTLKIPEGFSGFIQRLSALDDDKRLDLLDIFNVILEKFENSGDRYDSRLLNIPRQSAPARNTHTYKSHVSRNDDFKAPFFAKNSLDIVIGMYFEQLPWIGH